MAALLKWRSTIPLPRKPYALVSGINKKSSHLSDGLSEQASERVSE